MKKLLIISIFLFIAISSIYSWPNMRHSEEGFHLIWVYKYGGHEWIYMELRSHTGALLGYGGMQIGDEYIVWQYQWGDFYWPKEAEFYLEEFDNLKLQYYNDRIHINGVISGATLRLFDISGLLVHEAIIDSKNEVDLHGISGGLYIATIEFEQKISSFKIMVGG